MNDTMIVKFLLRFAAFGAAFYGVWIWFFHSFNGTSAFSAWRGVPEYALSLPLLVGSIFQVLGERYQLRWSSFVGLLCCLAVFVAAEISCCLSALPSTGVPGYVIIGGLYLFLAIVVAARIPSEANA